MPIPKLYGMERIKIEEVMDKLEMFQYIFGKIHEFGWWDSDKFSAYAGMQFTWTEFEEESQTCAFCVTLAAPEYLEMNRQVKMR